MKLYIGLLILLSFSCKNRQENPISNITAIKIDTIQKVESANSLVDTTGLEEYFIDSLNVGKKTFNKLEISKYRTIDSNYVIIKFYSKRKDSKWILKNKFEFAKDGITGCDVKLSDLNNDGLNDLTCVSAVAARGANEVRRLFIYDKNNDKLFFLKNSEDYPNMLYNKELNCIDAFLVHGGSSTVFLKIKGDSLKEFASVHLGNNLIIYEFDKNGKEVMIRQDTTNELDYVRFKNYKPLKKYDEY